mmetsp:Transcript_37481/g.112401  ORF Transcript_37481/g.112401 Transcript_37481/m.112401 type:complete len:928 (-) Transcript_37481:116-2899(-)
MEHCASSTAGVPCLSGGDTSGKKSRDKLFALPSSAARLSRRSTTTTTSIQARPFLNSHQLPGKTEDADTDARGINHRRGLKIKVALFIEKRRRQLLWALVLTPLLSLFLMTRFYLPPINALAHFAFEMLSPNPTQDSRDPAQDKRTLQQLPTTKIVAIGCSRPHGLVKALTSARKAVPVGEQVSLDICIDGCGNEEVAAVARQFHWPHGEKHFLIRSPPGLGLAKHIVGCWPDPRPGEWALFIEDDVILSPYAFAAYREALVIRARHAVPGNIFGIALHDSRVNQYCWKTHGRRVACPRIQTQCKTRNAQESIFGNLQCDHELSNASWILRQVPSSWGAIYEGGAWQQFKDYWAHRADLTPSQELGVAVPLSMSNEWTKSWKRSLMELMFANGWTLLYRSQPDQMSFATTLRSQGVHTYNFTSKDSEARCLMSLPLDNRSKFTADQHLLSSSPISLVSLDYCGIEASVPELIAKGASWKNDMRHNLKKSSPLYPAVTAMGRVGSQYSQRPLLNASQILLAHRIAAMNRVDLVLVTSIGTFDETFKSMLAALEALGGTVKLLVAAPANVCPKLRGYTTAMCLEETECINPHGGNGLPVITKLLRAALDMAQPKAASWVGVVNADLIFDASLLETLSLLNQTSKCISEACVITGQRFDVDHATHVQTLHSYYGMDYFIFNQAGIELALSLKLPPLTIGRVRWDSWFMGYFSFLEGMNTIDASSRIRVLHYMDMKDSYLSKRVQDVTNLKLADEFFRLGRTTWANYRITEGSTLVPQVSTNEIQAKYHSNIIRYAFDRRLEEATEFMYTTIGMQQPEYGCLCELLSLLFSSQVLNFSAELYCTPSEYFNKSHAILLRPRVFLRKGVFERLAGMAPHSLTLARVKGLATEPKQASKCCMFKESTATVEIPEQIWTMEADSGTFICTQTHKV